MPAPSASTARPPAWALDDSMLPMTGPVQPEPASPSPAPTTQPICPELTQGAFRTPPAATTARAARSAFPRNTLGWITAAAAAKVLPKEIIARAAVTAARRVVLAACHVGIHTHCQPADGRVHPLPPGCLSCQPRPTRPAPRPRPQPHRRPRRARPALRRPRQPSPRPRLRRGDGQGRRGHTGHGDGRGGHSAHPGLPHWHGCPTD